MPTQTVTERVVTAPAYAPGAYVARGYEPPPAAVVPEPRYRYSDEWSDSDSYYETDRYPDQVAVPPTTVVNPTPPVVVERVVTPAGIAIGAQLPSTVPVYAMPPAAVVRVPNSSRYHYAYVNGQILLVDPNTNIVLAALQQ